MAIFDEHCAWPERWGLEELREAMKTIPPPFVFWSGPLLEGSLLDRLRSDPGRPERIAVEPAVCTIRSTGASSIVPVEWGERRLHAGPTYDVVLNDDGTPELDENGQWIWKRRE